MDLIVGKLGEGVGCPWNVRAVNNRLSRQREHNDSAFLYSSFHGDVLTTQMIPRVTHCDTHTCTLEGANWHVRKGSLKLKQFQAHAKAKKLKGCKYHSSIGNLTITLRQVFRAVVCYLGLDIQPELITVRSTPPQRAYVS